LTIPGAGVCKLRRWLGKTRPARVVYEPTDARHGAFERACAGHLPLCKGNRLPARRPAQVERQMETSRPKSRRASARPALVAIPAVLRKPLELANAIRDDRKQPPKNA